MDSNEFFSIVVLFITFGGIFAIIIIGAVIREKRKKDKKEKLERIMADFRKNWTLPTSSSTVPPSSTLPTSYDELMEQLGADAFLERFEKDITDPEFLPRSEQDYVNALAARYHNVGYKIISQNCHTRGADLIMSRRDRKILVEAKFNPGTGNFYSSIGQCLRYGVENRGMVLAIAIFKHGYIPNWFTQVCKTYDILLINSLNPDIEDVFVESRDDRLDVDE